MFVELVDLKDQPVFVNPALVTHILARRAKPDEETMIYFPASGETQSSIIVKGEVHEIFAQLDVGE